MEDNNKNKWLERSERWQKRAEQFDKAGKSMSKLGGKLTIMFTVPILLAIFFGAWFYYRNCNCNCSFMLIKI
ncbi:hypothetical protein G8V03_09705 [Clostridium botulinum D/C]|uniref:hypothetical protein n=1 Tax=Clostridium botulinum TaxID=1491 RepID=UPI001E54ABE1|nr:hypothetical protein [Clostridium botulinum]MCD3351260.1 hypothetical protein [Clostridium botulinum D/C]MCD3360217.1 hypothetical protein [Clostridium botulinum D/C]MCD3361680.1 hypothetical protein [Clostridium botulinum D/C]MCD3366022.1 hypothetical protein [Clostridium botulinum D/C]